LPGDETMACKQPEIPFVTISCRYFEFENPVHELMGDAAV
jgi:hypothetical protein